MNHATRTSDTRRATQRTARTIVQSGLVALSLLVGALAFGGCGDEGDAGACNHCCTCNCTGDANCPASDILLSDTCLDCDKDCQNWCIASSTVCNYVSSDSCDDDTVCPCNCDCAECPEGVNGTDVGAICAGTCSGCAGPCREACVDLGCARVDFFAPEVCQ
jgi:hypothetical protein